MKFVAVAALFPLIGLVDSSILSLFNEPACLTPKLPTPILVVNTDQSIMKYDRVISFGDSLNDNGALKKKTLGLYPGKNHYCDGRFSNGLVWVEYLTDMITNHFNYDVELKDFSVGGSSVTKSLKSLSPILTSLDQQIAQQFQDYKKDSDNKKFNNTLVTIWFGGNDYLLTKTQPQEVVAKLESLIKQYILNLNVNTLMLGDLPPLNRPLGNYSKKELQRRIDLTNEHNQYFNSMLVRLNSYIKANKVATRLVNFKTGDLLDPLLEGQYDADFFDGPLKVDKPCSDKNLLINICKNPTEYLFWDYNHPTTSVHRYMAHKVSGLLMY